MASAVAVALLALSTPAGAAPKRISGKLDERGYTVIALAASGEAVSRRAKSTGKFKLRAPAREVTLHLRAKDGTYAGPVVARTAKKGRRAIMGVMAGANLGKVKVRAAKGYAKAARPRKRWIDTKRQARARRGDPIGAGRFGRVRSKHTRGGVPGDRDLDGIPDRFDVDDDGDLVLDNVDRSTGKRAFAAETASEFHIHSVLNLTIDNTANANAIALTDEDIDNALSGEGVLILGILPGDSAELDCRGLIYCSFGGTGTFMQAGDPTPQPFPDCCDPDGDGFGTLPNNSPDSPPPGFLFFSPGATTDQIGTGDVLIERVASGGSESEVPTMLPFIFATVPALVSYDDGAGNSAAVDYSQGSPGMRGTSDNPFPIAARANGDIKLTVTFWRPQRRPIPGETGEWTDIGGLSYAAAPMRIGEQDTSVPKHACPQSAFSEDDTTLAPATSEIPYGGNAGGVKDLAPDRPASPANTLTYTLNLSTCLAAHGFSWEPGETAGIQFAAVDEAVGATITETETNVDFELQP